MFYVISSLSFFGKLCSFGQFCFCFCFLIRTFHLSQTSKLFSLLLSQLNISFRLKPRLYLLYELSFFLFTDFIFLSYNLLYVSSLSCGQDNSTWQK